jgi:uncharacterized protein YdaU (DUF1376 family)
MKAPAFQFYVNDFKGDPDVDLLDNEQLGAYLRLMLTAWAQPEPGVLPLDDEKLSKWSRMGKRWASNREAILACFKRTDDGRLVQKRMAAEHAKQVARRQERQEAGRRGAEARWDKHWEQQGYDDAAALMARSSIQDGSAIAQPSLSHSSAIDQPMANDASSSSSSASSSEKERESPRAREAPTPARLAKFGAWWGERTGELMADAHQLGMLVDKLEAYAAKVKRPFEDVADEAIAAFRAEVESWREPRPLTAKLANGKWSEIQPRMAGKVPKAKPSPSAKPDEKPASPRQPSARDVFVSKFG